MQDSELQTRSADRADSSHRQVLGTPSAFQRASTDHQEGDSVFTSTTTRSLTRANSLPGTPGGSARGLSVPGAVPSAQTLGLTVLVVVLVFSNERAAPGRVMKLGRTGRRLAGRYQASPRWWCSTSGWCWGRRRHRPRAAISVSRLLAQMLTPARGTQETSGARASVVSSGVGSPGMATDPALGRGRPCWGRRLRQNHWGLRRTV